MKNEYSARHSEMARQSDRQQAGIPALRQPLRLGSKAFLGIGLLAGLAMLAACSGDMSGDSKYPSQTGIGPTTPNPTGERQTIFGEDGITLFGGGSDDKTTGAQGIGVNSFLWRASLDTISFMPLASADPFGGVIITDWYQDPKAPGERFKLTVYILDKRLRADGVKVSVFRQKLDSKLGWVDEAIDAETGTKIENAILVRARQLHISSTVAGDVKE
jgi:hypothetical protein